MSSNPLRLQILLQKYLDNTCSRLELKEFWSLLKEVSDNDLLDDELEQLWNRNEATIKVSDTIKKKLYTRIIETAKDREINFVRLHRTNPWPKRLAIAAIFIMAIASTYLFLNQEQTGSTPSVAQTETQLQNDVAPGKDGAILTLADGTQIVLDDLKDGAVTTAATKTGDVLSYSPSGAGGNDQPSTINISYNTISTPNGRQYSLVLPDGSKVWLNAASSITFPTAFVGNERKVQFTGEAYFEVAKDVSKPFHVLTKDQNVTVLGTHFNINSYDDEDVVRTTLLEGRVNVSSLRGTKQSAILQPGQQALLSTNNYHLSTQRPDLDAVMSWKKGLFNFNDADITEIMKQATRWYDVEVKYQGTTSSDKFKGKISRNTNLSQLLKILEINGVKWKIEGKVVTIMN